MSFRNLPSLTGLRAFEAVARLGSFKAAAAELGVTPAAVRAQLQTLEAWFGSALLLRNHKHIEPTPAALRLQAGLNTAFSGLRDAVQGFVSERPDQPLTLAVGTLFASRWLSPRLGDLQQENPDIALKLTRSPTADEFEGVDASAAILWGSGDWREHRATPVFQPALLPVASPDYLARQGTPEDPRALAQHTLIVEDRFSMWQMWFGAQGFEIDQPPGKTLVVRDGSLSMQLALDGQGIYLAVAEFIEPELAAQTLLPLARATTLGSMAYHFACPERLAGDPRVTRLRQWFSGQA